MAIFSGTNANVHSITSVAALKSDRHKYLLINLPFLCSASIWPTQLPATAIAFRIRDARRPTMRWPCRRPVHSRPRRPYNSHCSGHCYCCPCCDNDCRNNSGDYCIQVHRQSCRVAAGPLPNDCRNVCYRAGAWNSYSVRLFAIDFFSVQSCNIRLCVRTCQREE